MTNAKSARAKPPVITEDDWRYEIGRIMALRNRIALACNLPDSAFILAAPPLWCPSVTSVMGMRVELMLGITKPQLVIVDA